MPCVFLDAFHSLVIRQSDANLGATQTIPPIQRLRTSPLRHLDATDGGMTALGPNLALGHFELAIDDQNHLVGSVRCVPGGAIGWNVLSFVVFVIVIFVFIGLLYPSFFSLIEKVIGNRWKLGTRTKGIDVAGVHEVDVVSVQR